MVADDYIDLSHLNQVLTPIFEKYPAGNHCDVCAKEVSDELQKELYRVATVTIRNESMPAQPGSRPPFIHGRNVGGQPFLLGQTGFHQTVRIEIDDTPYYVDPLVYIHYGLRAVNEVTYWSLFWYPDGVEITDIQEV